MCWRLPDMSKHVAYILPCVIKTVVLTYKLVS